MVPKTFRVSTDMAGCEQPTRTPTKLRSRQFQRFILSRLTVGAQIRHGNPPFLRLTAEFERSEKPATSSVPAARLAISAIEPSGATRTIVAPGPAVSD